MSVGKLEGRVAVVTGAGRGLGRAHALYLASEGAQVVVNDPGVALDGSGSDTAPAESVVQEILAAGGSAVASHHDISGWSGAAEAIQTALDAFGNLHILVNNAGILRDRSLVNLAEDEWNAVISVHLTGHAATTHHAAQYWRERAKSGQPVNASVINTTSVAGFLGGFGQASYAAAKLGIVSLTYTTAIELGRYGVRANAVSPSANTRLTMSVPPDQAFPAGREADDGFDRHDPANVSPLIGWLASAECRANSQVFHLDGERLFVVAIPAIAHRFVTSGRWTMDRLDQCLRDKLVPPLPVDAWQ